MVIRLNKKGFTLLELIIVIIIVGVLASLALTRFFLVVERARTVEAVSNIKIIRQSVERCYLMHSGNFFGGCNNFSDLGIDDPGVSPGSHFRYSVIPSNFEYIIIASRNTYELSSSATAASPSEIWNNQCGGSIFTFGSDADIGDIILCADGAGNIWIKGFALYHGMSW